MNRPTLLFVSTRFLFPVDSGGKIRTTQILRGLKGGKYRIVLASPSTPGEEQRYAGELQRVCDDFIAWRAPTRGPLFKLTRMIHLPGDLPISVRTDRHPEGLHTVRYLLDERKPAVAVFDFAHAAVLAPPAFECPTVMFTHNVEAELFSRHRDVAGNPVYRRIWGNQHRKMRRFEQNALRRFDVVVTVSERDSRRFEADYGIIEPFVIPTGVDLDYFDFREPARDRQVVFCGSMDWMANQNAMDFFMGNVWPRIAERAPDAAMTVVGRSPPDDLVAKARRKKLNWEFTGYVDDVRPFMQGAAVSVIPINVGGGTRLKAYESMAMGIPVVSTTIGMEGLPARPGEHYLCADDPAHFADTVLGLLDDAEARRALAVRARSFVEHNFSYVIAAREFEKACELAVGRFSDRAAT